jgi:hypothetical protein
MRAMDVMTTGVITVDPDTSVQGVAKLLSGSQRRSRANLRPRSRSASVINRLLKNQNPLENRNDLRSSSPHLVLDRRPGNRAAILRSEIHRHGSHGCSDRRRVVECPNRTPARRSAAAAS